MTRPKVVCLCGSTRFFREYDEANLQETLAGRIVLSVGCYTRSDAQLGIAHDSDTKAKLDELHLRKIDLCDDVLVLNVGGYIGESTANELAYAVAFGKGLRFLEPERGDEYMHEHADALGKRVADHIRATVPS